MDFTYSGNPANSDLDRLRFLIGDTVESRAILTDAELNYILSEYTSERARLAVAFRQCANFFAMRMAKRKLGPQSEDTTDRQEYYARMADKYEKEQMYAGTPPLPEYTMEPIFDKGMMENDV